MLQLKCFLPVCGVVLAYLYIRNKEPYDVGDIRAKQIIDAWQKQITAPKESFNRVAVGINACVDLIVNGTEVLKALNIKPAGQEDHHILNTLEELQEAFHYHFSRGIGGERHFGDGVIFKDIVTAASIVENGQWYIGGNAALVAEQIVHLFPDVDVHLIGPVGPRLAELLPKHITVAKDGFETDEVHLILEYQVGELWGGSTTNVATRFITSHDMANSQLNSLQAFFDNVDKVHPDLLVLSGLHMLESQASTVWDEKMEALNNHLISLPKSLPAHLELASMSSETLLLYIMDLVVGDVTSLGLNEQELSFASKILGGPHKENIFNDKGEPVVHLVTDTLVWLLNQYHESDDYQTRLTRIHFHSLIFHIIITVPGKWEHSDIAVAAGTRRAGRRACDVNTLVPTDIDLRIPESFPLFTGGEEITFDPSNPVLSFQYDGYDISFSPVLVCRKPLKTVGLGDSISATGLLYSKYKTST